MLIKKEDQPIKVGVLLPRSNQYPDAGTNFINGVKLFFTLHDNRFERGKVELVVEEVGFGNEQLANEKAYKLIAQDQVVLIISLLQPNVAKFIGKLCDMAKVPLVNSSLGEATISQDDPNELVFFNSLFYWQSYYLLGEWAAKKWDRPFVIFSSFYDTGYDPLRTLRAGIIQNGGNIINEVISHSINDDQPLDFVKSNISNHQEIIPIAIYHPLLLRQVLPLMEDQYTDILVTPFESETKLAKKYWAFPEWKNRKTEQNSKFETGAKEFLGVEPDLFLLLGYEAGQLAYEAVSGLADPEQDSENIQTTLQSYSSTSPRGPVSMCSITKSIISSIAIFSGRDTKNYSIEQEFEEIVNDRDDKIKEINTDIKSSFLNPYMFF